MTDAELIARLRTWDGESSDVELAADRIEALEHLLSLSKLTTEAVLERAVEAEAKLASAVASLEHISKTYPADADRLIHSGRMILSIARDALAEIAAEQNETKP